MPSSVVVMTNSSLLFPCFFVRHPHTFVFDQCSALRHVWFLGWHMSVLTAYGDTEEGPAGASEEVQEGKWIIPSL